MSVDDICDALGTTREAVADSAAFVEDYVALRDRVIPVQTTDVLPSGEYIHLHQLVVDDANERFLVTDLDGDEIELTRAFPPVEFDTVGFGEQYLVDPDELVGVGEPQTVRAEQSVPVWGY